MIGRRAARTVLLIALATSAACSRPPAPNLLGMQPILLAAQPEPPCPPISLEQDPAPKRAEAAPAKSADVSLSVFFAPRSPKPAPRRSPRIDLGKIVHRDAEPLRRDPIDVSRLGLPREVPREDLPEALRGKWDQLFADRDKLNHARKLEVSAERRLKDCEATACPLGRCLSRLHGDLASRARAIEASRHAELAQFIEDLQNFMAASHDRSGAGAALALGYAAEERIHESAELSDLDAPIALYERARQLAAPGSEIAWWARYKLGSALADGGQSVRAGREFAALAALPAAPKLRADVTLRQAELAPDEDHAAPAYQAAMTLSASDAAALEIHIAAAYRLADVEIDRRRFATALDAAAEIVRSAERSSLDPLEIEMFGEMATPLLAQIVSAASVAEIASPPSVPAAIIGPLGAAVADQAIARFDVAAAVRAWHAVLTYAPGALEAPRAITGLIAAHEREGHPEAALPLRQRRARDYGPGSAWAARHREGHGEARLADRRVDQAALALPPPLPRIPVNDLDRERDLTGRLEALLTACAGSRSPDDPDELEIRVDLDPKTRVTAQAPKGSTSGAALTACLAALGPAYFVDAPAELRATIQMNLGMVR